jgi:hypothetical protein
VLVLRQLHQDIEGSGWIELVDVIRLRSCWRQWLR